MIRLRTYRILSSFSEYYRHSFHAASSLAAENFRAWDKAEWPGPAPDRTRHISAYTDQIIAALITGKSAFEFSCRFYLLGDTTLDITRLIDASISIAG